VLSDLAVGAALAVFEMRNETGEACKVGIGGLESTGRQCGECADRCAADRRCCLRLRPKSQRPPAQCAAPPWSATRPDTAQHARNAAARLHYGACLRSW